MKNPKVDNNILAQKVFGESFAPIQNRSGLLDQVRQAVRNGRRELTDQVDLDTLITELQEYCEKLKEKQEVSPEVYEMIKDKIQNIFVRYTHATDEQKKQVTDILQNVAAKNPSLRALRDDVIADALEMR